jgi:hypothetical protein
MTLEEWAVKYNISVSALTALRLVFIRSTEAVATSPISISEAAVQNNIRFEASKLGGRLWRNNLGAGKLENGSFIRWGLCNDSAALNNEVKSADLIGLRPITITPAHVGTTIGQFWSVECKRPGWRYHGDPRERAQLRWAKTIAALGGLAIFSTGEL